MKKLFALALSLGTGLLINAQTKTTTATKTTKPAAKPVAKQPVKAVAPKVSAAPVVLKTQNDSVSYAMGITAGVSFKQEGLPTLKAGLCAKGIEDVQSNQPVLFDDQTGYNVWVRFSSQLKAAQANKGAKSTATTPKPAAKAVPANALLKPSLDSVSYAIGMDRAMFAKQQGIENISTSLFERGLKDIQQGAKTAFDDGTAYQVMNKYLMDLEMSKAAPNIKAGEEFLAKNKLRPGVITTASGLQYEIIKDSAGVKPTAADTFVCHYRGTLLDGTEFDASYNRNEPLTLGVSQVIRGWTEGLQLMGVGSKYKFYIPYELAYGPMANGQIPGGSMLIFEVELLNVIKANQP